MWDQATLWAVNDWNHHMSFTPQIFVQCNLHRSCSLKMAPANDNEISTVDIVAQWGPYLFHIVLCRVKWLQTNTTDCGIKKANLHTICHAPFKHVVQTSNYYLTSSASFPFSPFPQLALQIERMNNFP